MAEMRTALALGALFSLLIPLACNPEDHGEGIPVKRGDLVLGVELTGELRAADSDIVGPPSLDEIWNFSITKLATEGTTVAAGDVVLAFDPSELDQQLVERIGRKATTEENLAKRLQEAEQARRDEALRLAEAEAAVRKAALRAEVEPDLGSSVDLRVAALDLALAHSELEATRSRAEAAIRRDQAEIAGVREEVERAVQELETARRAIVLMKVRALRPGVVIGLPGRRGEKPKVGDRVWRAQRVAEVVNLESLYGWGQVEEPDMSRVVAGQPVSVRLDAQSDVEIHGTVRRVLSSVQRAGRDDPNRIVRVEVDLEAKEGVKLRPGMRFRGEVETARRPAVLILPIAAVGAGDDGAHAWTTDGTRIDIEIGGRNTRDVEVLAGLAEGDRVLALPPEEGSP